MFYLLYVSSIIREVFCLSILGLTWDRHMRWSAKAVSALLCPLPPGTFLWDHSMLVRSLNWVYSLQRIANFVNDKYGDWEVIYMFPRYERHCDKSFIRVEWWRWVWNASGPFLGNIQQSKQLGHALAANVSDVSDLKVSQPRTRAAFPSWNGIQNMTATYRNGYFVFWFCSDPGGLQCERAPKLSIRSCNLGWWVACLRADLPSHGLWSQFWWIWISLEICMDL